MYETTRVLVAFGTAWNDMETVEDWLRRVPQGAVVAILDSDYYIDRLAAITDSLYLTRRIYANVDQAIASERPHLALVFADDAAPLAQLISTAVAAGLRVTVVPSGVARIRSRNLDFAGGPWGIAP